MGFSNLFRTKDVAQIKRDAELGYGDHGELTVEDRHLRKTLGVVDLTAFGIAAIIGAGIFSTIGTAAFNGGPAVAFLFVFTAIACAFSALCYAEFASQIPVAGSAYTYAYASFGELVAWIIGWDLLIEYAIGNIAVAISWSDYFTGLLSGYGLRIPEHFAMDYRSASKGSSRRRTGGPGGRRGRGTVRRRPPPRGRRRSPGRASTRGSRVEHAGWGRRGVGPSACRGQPRRCAAGSLPAGSCRRAGWWSAALSGLPRAGGSGPGRPTRSPWAAWAARIPSVTSAAFPSAASALTASKPREAVRKSIVRYSGKWTP